MRNGLKPLIHNSCAASLVYADLHAKARVSNVFLSPAGLARPRACPNARKATPSRNHFSAFAKKIFLSRPPWHWRSVQGAGTRLHSSVAAESQRCKRSKELAPKRCGRGARRDPTASQQVA